MSKRRKKVEQIVSFSNLTARRIVPIELSEAEQAKLDKMSKEIGLILSNQADAMAAAFMCSPVPVERSHSEAAVRYGLTMRNFLNFKVN